MVDGWKSAKTSGWGDEEDFIGRAGDDPHGRGYRTAGNGAGISAVAIEAAWSRWQMRVLAVAGVLVTTDASPEFRLVPEVVVVACLECVSGGSARACGPRA